jgi:hypothetical protein
MTNIPHMSGKKAEPAPVTRMRAEKCSITNTRSMAIALACDAINKLIKYIRKNYPPLLTVAQYCEIKNCCQATAYNDFKKYPGLALKDGRSTRVNLEFTIDIIANLPPWVPEKETVDEKEKPYERSRRRAETVSSPSDAVKPLPAPSGPAATAQPERPAGAKPRPRSGPRQRATVASTASTSAAGTATS